MILERQPLFILDSKVGALAENLLDIAVGGGGCEVDAKHIGPEKQFCLKTPSNNYRSCALKIRGSFGNSTLISQKVIVHKLRFLCTKCASSHRAALKCMAMV